MSKLTSKEKAKIRKYAQRIKPTFQIGSLGFHKEVVQAINEGLNNKEVLKIKVNRDDKFDKKIVNLIAQEMEEKLSCQIAGVIGTTIIIYKENLNLVEDLKILK